MHSGCWTCRHDAAIDALIDIGKLDGEIVVGRRALVGIPIKPGNQFPVTQSN
jgi:hypothetical protein